MKKKCSECDFAILDDYGYSNYTTEGTTVHCSKALHPDGDFDRYYGEDKRDSFAETCSAFSSEVGPVEVDCDREDLRRGSKDGSPECFGAYATSKVSAQKISDILG